MDENQEAANQFGNRDQDYIPEDQDSSEEIDKDNVERYAISLKLTREAKRQIQNEQWFLVNKI